MVSDQVLHYRLLGKLGAGGMGVVYRALDTRLERIVALKFLPETLTADPAPRQRLFTEAQAAAKLDHPNVGIVYAIEEGEAGQLFIVMAHYEGKTLEKRLIPLPIREALSIGLQLARGLAHAHKAAVVHHDIKPANVMLTPQEQVKILDFGLAKLKEPNGLVEAGLTLGTMEYASPEQVRGQPTDQRTDLWSLGVMLYELLTGVSPFRGGRDASAAMLQILSKEPPPASTVNTEVPPATDEVLARLLAKDAGARYGTALEVAEALGALPRGELAARTAAPVSAGVLQNTLFSPTQPVVQEPVAQIPHKLPRPLTPLVGRQDELALLDMYLQDPDCQIVTLLGLGGTGKTRLSIAVAWEQLAEGHFADGIYFAPLETLNSANLIPTSVAEALALDLQRGDDLLEQIVRYIGDKHVLLVLDNYERLLAQHPKGTEGALVASELARNCPNLKLLVTSRERLNLLEEWTLPLQGLPYPRHGAGGEDDAHTFGAVQLFVQRAKRVLPSFTLSPENRADVVAICQLVKGLPLGIELAAVWVKMMSCADITSEMRKNLDFLTTSARNVAERHRSIRAVFEGSWNLLEPGEQEAWRKLAVFRGGFTKRAAQHVANVSLAMLASLADKSLLQTTATGRYDQHTLLLGYAWEKLAEFPDQQRRVEESYADYYLDFLREQGESVRGPHQQAALAAIGEELENIRVAWRGALTETKLEQIRDAAEPLRVFYDRRGRVQEGIDLFSKVPEEPTEPAQQAVLGYALANQAWLCLLASRFGEAADLAGRSLVLLRPLEEVTGVILGLNTLGAANGSLGNYAQAKLHFEEALALANSQDDQKAVAIFLDNLASIDQSLGDYTSARRYYEKSLELSRQSRNHSQTVHSLNNLGNLVLQMGQLKEAQGLLHEDLRLAREHGVQRLVPFFLANLGSLSFKLSEFTKAEVSYREALRLVGEGDETWLEVWLRAELGRVAAALSRYPEAQQHLAGGLKAAWELEDTPLVVHILACVAEFYAGQVQYEQTAKLVSVVLACPATEQEDIDLAQQLLGKCQKRLTPEAMAWALKWGETTSLEEVTGGVTSVLSPPS